MCGHIGGWNLRVFRTLRLKRLIIDMFIVITTYLKSITDLMTTLRYKNGLNVGVILREQYDFIILVDTDLCNCVCNISSWRGDVFRSYVG